MLYNNWSYQLFDEFYPKYELPHGEIKWCTSELLKLNWGGKTHDIHLNEFYDADDENPVARILEWIYGNMPMLPEELENAMISKDFATEIFMAHCERDSKFYREIIDDPQSCPNYGNTTNIEEFLNVELEGTLLRVESTNKNIPVSTFLSHKDLVNKYIGNHFYDYKNIDLMFEMTRRQPRRIIVGHENSIKRFTDDTSDFTRMSLLDWFDKLPEGKEK